MSVSSISPTTNWTSGDSAPATTSSTSSSIPDDFKDLIEAAGKAANNPAAAKSASASSDTGDNAVSEQNESDQPSAPMTPEAATRILTDYLAAQGIDTSTLKIEPRHDLCWYPTGSWYQDEVRVTAPNGEHFDFDAACVARDPQITALEIQHYVFGQNPPTGQTPVVEA